MILLCHSNQHWENCLFLFCTFPFCLIYLFSHLLDAANRESREMEKTIIEEDSSGVIKSGIKSHKCKQCPFSSALASNLKIHTRIHTGDKSIKCNLCNYSTVQCRGSDQTYDETLRGKASQMRPVQLCNLASRTPEKT